MLIVNSSFDGPLGGVQFLISRHEVAVVIHVQVFVRTGIFILLGSMPRYVVARSYGN